jgi:hypothetical protein
MNNLLYLRDAYFHLTDPEMHYSMHEFLSALINNHHTVEQSSSFVQPRHLLNISDPRISILFSGTITFYSTVFIGRIRFTTSKYCHRKSSDDSSIVYRAGKEVHFGRIHRIFTVDDGDVLFEIFTLASSTHFSCETADEQFYYDEIQMGMIASGTTTCIIKADQIIEKCVFYLQPNSYATFIRFPNLEESS